MEWDVCHIFTPDLYIKTTLYVHTVTSHCVSCKHVTRTIARTVWVLFCTCVITDSILVDLYPSFGRHSHTWMHTLMHMYTQPHTHAHATHKYTCTFTNTMPHTHTHMHTYHHVHAGWSQFSLYCKPEWSWQDCGDAPSGWGYSRPADQGGKSCSSVNCSVMYIQLQRKHTGQYCLCYLDRDINLKLGVLSSF